LIPPHFNPLGRIPSKLYGHEERVKIMRNIKYCLWNEFPGWSNSQAYLLDIIAGYKPKSILEIGSGRSPMLPVEMVKNADFTYTTNDIDEEELEKAHPAYKRLLLDLCDGDLSHLQPESYDLIFSHMVNEHVKDGRKYYSNIYNLLKPRGITWHAFSTLYALPFVANWIIHEKISDALLSYFAPRDRDKHGKFAVHYSWSRGPLNSSIAAFESIGFDVVEYIGAFGHSYYKSRLPLLHKFEKAKASFLLCNPIPQLTSFASVLLRKPERGR
jgi:SAM-dependent methyltransferase